jgi:Mg-chelatase subunit ChlD
VSNAHPDAAVEAANDAASLDVRAWSARIAVTSAALGTILLAVGAWLLFPRERAGTGPMLPPLRVCLVDVSASAIWRRRDWGGWIDQALVGQAREAERAGEDVCTILYGSAVRRDFGPAPARSFLDEAAQSSKDGGLLTVPPAHAGHLWAEDATRVSDALEVARGLAQDPSRASCRVVLIGDGTYTGNDPRPILRELRDLGVSLERLDLPLADVPEVTVGPLSLPREVEAGAPIAVDAEVFFGPGTGPAPETTVALTVKHGFESGFNSEYVKVPVPTGLAPDEDGYLRWRVRREVGRAEPGLNTVRITGLRHGRGDDADTADSSEGFVWCAGRLAVGWVTAERRVMPGGDRPQEIPGIHSTEGLQVEALFAHELAGQLGSLDAIVTCDIPLDRLPGEILASFVRRGGGWLALAGRGFLSGFDRSLPSPPDDPRHLLPLEPPDEKLEPRDVVLLVDRSGSMAGERSDLVRRAVLVLMDDAPPGDAVELRFFSDRLSEAIPLIGPGDPRGRERARSEAADRVFVAQGPGGPTALVRSLEELASAREKSGREGLVFLLTDGRDNTDPDPAASCPRILQRMLAARAKLVVIAAGDDADRGLLSRLVAPGERLEEVGSLLDLGMSGNLERIFRRELDRDRVREGEQLRVLPSPTLLAPSSVATVGADVLRAQKPESAADWPAIQRYVRTKVVPGAGVLWISETGEPLLALQRVGLGMTAACAFAPIADSGQAWRDRSDLFEPLLRALARGKREPLPRLRVEADELFVEDLPADAPALLEARVFSAQAREGDAPAAVIALSPPIQGADPRRVRTGRWSASLGGGFGSLWDEFQLDTERERTATARVPRVEICASGAASHAWPPIQLALAPPQVAEFRLPRPRIPAMEFLAANPARGEHPGASRGARWPPQPHPAAPWVLFSGLLLLAVAGLSGFFSRRAP